MADRVCRNRRADPASTTLETLGDNHFAPCRRRGRASGSGSHGTHGRRATRVSLDRRTRPCRRLAVTVSVEDEDVVGDPGAGSYFGHPDWRGPTEAPGLTPRSSRRSNQSVRRSLSVDGACSGPGPCDRPRIRGGRRRTSRVPPPEGRGDPPAVVGGAAMDARASWSLTCCRAKAGTLVRTSWPLASFAGRIAEAAGHLLTRRGRPVAQIATAATAEIDVRPGARRPGHTLGWWSEQLESREPAWLVGARCFTGLPIVVATIIQPTDRPNRIEGLAVSHSGADIEVTWLDSGVPYRASIDTTDLGAVTLS